MRGLDSACDHSRTQPRPTCCVVELTVPCTYQCRSLQSPIPSCRLTHAIACRCPTTAAVRLAAKRQHSTGQSVYDVSGVSVCSTSGRYTSCSLALLLCRLLANLNVFACLYSQPSNILHNFSAAHKACVSKSQLACTLQGHSYGKVSPPCTGHIETTTAANNLWSATKHQSGLTKPQHQDGSLMAGHTKPPWQCHICHSHSFQHHLCPVPARLHVLPCSITETSPD